MGTKLSAITSDARLEPPASLAPAPARVWREIVNSLQADYFRPSDEPILRAFVIADSIHAECQAHVAEHGLFLEDDRGRKYTNPAAALMEREASLMAQLAIRLRLCPSARYTKGEKPQKGILGGGGSRPWETKSAA